MEFNKIFKEYVQKARPVKTTIQWYDLYEGHSVILNKDFQKQLLNQAIEKAGNISELSRRIQINRKVISNLLKCKFNPRIKSLRKIAIFLQFPLKHVNTKIIEIAGLRPKLPFNLHSEEGAEIRAAFLSDGHIDKNPTASSQYCASEKELHSSLIKLCTKIFGKFKTKTYFSKTTYYTKFPCPIGMSLVLSGVPSGNKLLVNPYLPKDILLGRKSIITNYLRRVYDDEGDVCFDRYGKRAVRITRSVNVGIIKERILPERWTFLQTTNDTRNNLLIGEYLLLHKLGIDARLYSEGYYKNKKCQFTGKWRIQIGQQDHVKKFAELINFTLSTKREKLKEILNSYQYRKLPNGKGKEEAYCFIRKTTEKKGFIKYCDLAREMVKTGRSYDLAGRYLKYFLDTNMIKKIKRGTYV
ncbi:MAG: hypothetical protein QGH47_05425, partial [Candidatus Woesearchaeota archaeon]|nr:hypothetical protein [Candidatus Woesearchaeota archaeon]